MHLLGGSTNVLTATVPTGTVYNYNIFNAVGQPNYKVDVQVTVPATSIIGSTTSAAALGTGIGLPGWVTGSTIRLIIYGAIEGRGGAGNGNAGGDAISLAWPIIIENYGFIRGGGGGGGFGRELYIYPNTWNAGGGGGGQGCIGGGKGLGGTTAPGYSGNDGNAGSEQTPGGGGAGAYTDYLGTVRSGGGGGSGGAWGVAGDPGGRNSNNEAGYAGGAAGYAIRCNGKTVTWITGNTTARVKGLVA